MCTKCQSIRDSVKLAWKTAHFERGTMQAYWVLGLYFGPHGRWYALRLCCFRWFVCISFKWVKPRIVNEAKESWR